MKRKKFKSEMASIITLVPRVDKERYSILCTIEGTNKSMDIANYIQGRINKNKDLIDRVLHGREQKSKQG